MEVQRFYAAQRGLTSAGEGPVLAVSSLLWRSHFSNFVPVRPFASPIPARQTAKEMPLGAQHRASTQALSSDAGILSSGCFAITRISN
jgi:hypothetical protein